MTPDHIYQGDCLEVMRGWPSGCVHLVYLDPPFGTGKVWSKDRSSFDDRWCWGAGAAARMATLPDRTQCVMSGLIAILGAGPMTAYLLFMAERIAEVHRIMRHDASIYLHCDSTASAYLRVLLDFVFGGNNFLAEIVWLRSSSSGGRTARKNFVKTHDTILAFAANYGAHTYNKLFTPYKEDRLMWAAKTDSAGRRYQNRNRKGLTVRQYMDESPGVPMSTIWTDLPPFLNYSKERVGYPTQKPEALLSRILQASGHPGCVVLDPFCGSGTTCAVAVQKGMRYVGIDRSPDAVALARDRVARVPPRLLETA